MTYGVGGKCQVCAHPEIETIDAELVIGGESYAAIGKKHGAAALAIARHARKHLPRRLAAGLVPNAAAFSDDVVTLVQRHVARAWYLSQKAEAKGDLSVALSGVRTGLRGAALLARVLGELPPEQTTNVHINATIELKAIIATITDALGDQPPILRQRVAAALMAHARTGDGRAA
ncbi:MAG TPA: hypothetical protein VFA43_10680 [Gemmatimonadaceae bacterium]|nr:hypothetical protein [Gemmatimonadaceae bacterium]